MSHSVPYIETKVYGDVKSFGNCTANHDRHRLGKVIDQVKETKIQKTGIILNTYFSRILRMA